MHVAPLPFLLQLNHIINNKRRLLTEGNARLKSSAEKPKIRPSESMKNASFSRHKIISYINPSLSSNMV